MSIFCIVGSSASSRRSPSRSAIAFGMMRSSSMSLSILAESVIGSLFVVMASIASSVFVVSLTSTSFLGSTLGAVVFFFGTNPAGRCLLGRFPRLTRPSSLSA